MALWELSGLLFHTAPSLKRAVWVHIWKMGLLDLHDRHYGGSRRAAGIFALQLQASTPGLFFNPCVGGIQDIMQEQKQGITKFGLRVYI